MSYEIKIPNFSNPVTLRSVLTLRQIIGLPNPDDRWKLVPPDVLVPSGVPTVRGYPYTKGLGGLRAQVLEEPLWSSPSCPVLQNPEVMFVPAQDIPKLKEFPLPLPVPGKLVEVVLIDTSVGVLARGAQWHFTPSTTTEQYQEGTSYACDDSREFVDFFREEVVWWGGSPLGWRDSPQPSIDRKDRE